MKYTILVVDDDKEIRQGIKIYLEQENFTVVEAEDGAVALEKIKTFDIHLIILDVMMPNMDGIITTYRIRQENNVPILMVSAKSEEIDKVQGLQMGADDYLAKPFSPVELIARAKSLLRRYFTLGEYEQRMEELLEIDGLQLNIFTKQVFIEGVEKKLTPTEFKITQFLMEHPNRVFSINEIYETVWQEPSFNADNTISVHIRKIREKIEIDPKNPRYIKVVWGVGYKMEK